jgi:plastocyanin
MVKFTSLLILSLMGLTSAANLRAAEPAAEEHLDLELTLENGRRELFPLLPGTKCPAGHQCRARKSAWARGTQQMSGPSTTPSSIMQAMKDNLKSGLTVAEESALNNDLSTVVKSDDYCTRRNAMARAAGLAAGLLVSQVNAPAFAASTTEVGMGSDSGQLVFVPSKIKICKGDTVKWVIVKGGPHNVVFDEDAIPAGVSQEKISMDGQLGDEGESFSMTFDVAGEYDYYCEPHRSAGMQAHLTVA